MFVATNEERSCAMNHAKHHANHPDFQQLSHPAAARLMQRHAQLEAQLTEHERIHDAEAVALLKRQKLEVLDALARLNTH
jgi:uncharacterized protein YdcH (DUF465 family)